MRMRRVRVGRRLSAAVKAKSGTPFHTQGEVDAVAEAFRQGAGLAVAVADPTDGGLYFRLGDSVLGGPDTLRSD